MSNGDDFPKELELIQNVIDRQAENSFRIKGWTVTLVVVALLFRTDDFQLLVAFIPLIAFWGLDAYYLQVERKYREMYQNVRKSGVDSDRERFKMDPSEYETDVESVARLMLSNTILWFYGAILLLLVAYTLLSFVNKGTPAAGNITDSPQQLLSLLLSPLK